MTRLSVRLFGSLQCLTETGEPVLPVRPGARALFAALAFARRPLRRHALAAALWSDVTDEAARANLRRHLLYVERWLTHVTGAAVPIVRAAGGVALDLRAIASIDVHAFEDAIAAGALDDAATLYSGDLLTDMADEWIVADRRRLRARYDEVLVALVERAGARNDFASALRHADTGQDLDPYNEAWLRTAMRLRYAAGDRTGALHRYEAFVTLVRNELDVAPSHETVMLADSMRRRLDAHAEPPLRAIELTTFVGRHTEIRRLTALVLASRLVTVAGPPGSGKSRLTTHAARAFANRFRDGLVIIDATAADDAQKLERAILRARGEAPDVQIAQLEMLVVIDGCERNHRACAQLAERLLASAPEICILASSRLPLRVAAEHVYRLPPLGAADAAALFVQRVDAARAGEAEARLDAAIVERICRKLDGSPLAIELAAAQTRASTVHELERALDDNVHGPGREQLHALYESSYRQLTPLERAVFGRLAAFANGWQRRIGLAACADIAAEQMLLVTLGALVEHSLIVPPGVTATAPRYAMLEATRAFARECAAGRGERDADARACARATAMHYAAMSGRLRGQHAAEYYVEIERDHENVEGALATLWRGDAADAALATELSLSMSRFWTDQGFAREGEGWLRTALGNAADDTAKRLELLRVIGTLTRDRGDYRRSFTDFCELVRLHEFAGSSTVEIAKAQTMAANAARMTGNFDEAARRTTAAIGAFTAAGEGYLAAWAVYALGTTLLCAGRLHEAAAELERATAQFNELDAVADTSSSIANLALCHFYAGRLDVAQELAHESVARAQATGHRYYLAHAMLNEILILNALGDGARAWPLLLEANAIAAALGAQDVAISCAEAACALLASAQPEDAAILLGSTDSARERLHAHRFPIDEPLDHATRSILRAALGPERFEAVLMRGRMRPLRELLAGLQNAAIPVRVGAALVPAR